MFKLLHFGVQFRAPFLQHESVGETVELFVGQRGRVFGVNLTERGLELLPGLIEVELFSSYALLNI